MEFTARLTQFGGLAVLLLARRKPAHHRSVRLPRDSTLWRSCQEMPYTVSDVTVDFSIRCGVGAARNVCQPTSQNLVKAIAHFPQLPRFPGVNRSPTFCLTRWDSLFIPIEVLGDWRSKYRRLNCHASLIERQRQRRAEEQQAKAQAPLVENSVIERQRQRRIEEQ
jgi:hypothetical protein